MPTKPIRRAAAVASGVAALVVSATGDDGMLLWLSNRSQAAPATLRLLGLNPRALQAVRIEHTQVLPG